jgi:hypothetical protein
MPRGPRGEKRSADVVGVAINVARIATGELSEAPAAKSRRSQSGIAGSKARAESLSPKQRSEIAKRAAKARWR